MGPAEFDDDFDDVEAETYRSLPPTSARQWRHPAESAQQADRRHIWRAPAVLVLGSLIIGVAVTSAAWFALAPTGGMRSPRPFDQVALLSDRSPSPAVPTVAEVPLLRVERPDSTATVTALRVSEGVLVTAADLVRGSSRFTVVGDDREIGILAIDTANNIAILTTPRGGRLPLLSNEYAPDLGEQLIAIAGPGTVWLSTVAALDQRAPSATESVLFRIAAAGRIQLGASLLDTDGRTVGLVVRVEGNDGWAVPSRYLRAVAARAFEDSGSWPTGGLSLNKSDSYVYVTSVSPDGPAHSAGILPNDAITAVDTQRVTSAAEFFTSIMEAGAGRHLTIVYTREGAPRTSTLVVVRRSESTAAAAP